MTDVEDLLREPPPATPDAPADDQVVEAELVEDRRCVARAHRTGERCSQFAIRGGTVCVVHGGRAPQVRNAARRRLEQRRVQEALGKVLAEVEGEYGDEDPSEILLEQVRRAGAMTAVLGTLVARLGEDGLYGPDHLDDGRPHVAVEMYRTWSQQAAKLAKLAIEAGIDERRVQTVDRFGAELADVVRSILAQLGTLLGEDLLRRRDVLDVVQLAFAEADSRYELTRGRL